MPIFRATVFYRNLSTFYHTTPYRPPLPSVVINHFVGTMSEADFCKFNRCLSTRLTPVGNFSLSLLSRAYPTDLPG